MLAPLARGTSRLRLEQLESRDIPGVLTSVEPFQSVSAAGLPAGWGQWSSGGGAFAVDVAGTGLGDTGRLVTNGTSTTASRAWMTATFEPDVETSASVLLNSLIPIQLFARGQGLQSSTPTFYSVSAVRGVEVQLTKVVAGSSTVLASVKSVDYVSGNWVTVSLRLEGERLKVFVYRGDTNQYLTMAGTWTRQPTAAVDRLDSSIRSGGQVGFARGAKVSGTGVIDSFRVGPVPVIPTTLGEERFTSGPTTSLPAGWSRWTTGRVTFATQADETLRVDGDSTSSARAWMSPTVPADAQLSSSVFVDGLVPAGVFARGQAVDTAKPSYYGVTVARGLEVKLVRSVNGAASTLATLKSKEWVSGIWVQASLILKGHELRVQVYRSDTGQYLNADGTWGLVPAFALSRSDTAVMAAGRAGLLRGTGYAGQLVFDNFIVPRPPGR